MDTLVTREGGLFQVSDERGDFSASRLESGLFYRDTRYLSRLQVLVNGEPTPLLSVSAGDNYVQRVFARVAADPDPLFHHIEIGVHRRRVLSGQTMYEEIDLVNYGRKDRTVSLEIHFAADFHDLFEARGMQRPARGTDLPPQISNDRRTVRLGYRGLDTVLRETEIHFDHSAKTLSDSLAEWTITVPARVRMPLVMMVSVAESGAFVTPTESPVALQSLIESYRAWETQCAAIETDSVVVNRVVERSLRDLRLLLADRGHGPFLFAGIPWFATSFGRDSLIAAIQLLPFNPEIARGTLRTMAALQGTSYDAARCEQPGKIIHELRYGEMANLGEVPFGRYYGSVDSTPLFLMLLCEYYSWTADLGLIRELLPHLKAALTWMQTDGDPDGDGFLEYQADSRGLTVQSWKDSHDSVSYRDGRQIDGPVAISEAQGYAYDAQRRMAPIMAALGENDLARQLTIAADRLQESFNQAFWMTDRDYPAIALDGRKQHAGTVSSDAGHCLWTGIVDADKAARIAQRLMSPDLFSGWGIRTLSAAEVTYNPMSYHNGSVWPHDNALCVLGLKRYGFDKDVVEVASGLFDAAVHYDLFRLPELFCGFARTETGGQPVDYPVACSPQAWAAATPLSLIQAILGLVADAPARVLHLRPYLPPWLHRVSIRRLHIADATLDIEVTPDGVHVTNTQGDVLVVCDS